MHTDALDGLSSLAGYNINIERRKLFTRFYVDINQKYVMAAAAAAARYSGKYTVTVSLMLVACLLSSARQLPCKRR